jgi:hypothetical protein
MFIEICRATGLNPFLREVWFVPSVGIMAGRDGYLAVANRHPMFDGMSTHVDRDDKMAPVKATCTVWRKDRGHPIVCEAYYNEYRKGGNVWAQYPSAMISKVAEVLALKRSFAINGVVTEEEIGLQEPRGSAAASQAVAAAKLSGAMPLVSPAPAPAASAAPPPPAAPPADPLAATLAGFMKLDTIKASFEELKKAWCKYESAEAWDQTLEWQQFDPSKPSSIRQAKTVFTLLWNSVLKMQNEEQQQPVDVTTQGGDPLEQ